MCTRVRAECWCAGGNDDQSEPYFDDLCPVTFIASTVVIPTVEGFTYHVLAMGAFGEEGGFKIGLNVSSTVALTPRPATMLKRQTTMTVPARIRQHVIRVRRVMPV